MSKIRYFCTGKSLLCTAVVTVLVVCSSLHAASRINGIEEQNCYQTLFQTGEQLNQNIERLIRYDTEQLTAFAGLFSQYTHLQSEEVLDIVNRYEQCGMVSRLEILLPDNTILLQNGSRISAAGVLDFKEEAKQGNHLSNIRPDLMNPGKNVLRNSVPIIRNNDVIGILNGVIDLESLEEVWNLTLYGGAADIFIIDRSSGDFIMDTFHGELNNVSFMEGIDIVKGSVTDNLATRIQQGERGWLIFRGLVTGRKHYFCYMPGSIGEWEIGISVPESMVLENEQEVKAVLYPHLFFEMLCLTVYFVWIFFYTRQENNEKQERMELMSFTTEVQGLLFEAHQKPEDIDKALALIAGMTGAQYAFFKISDKAGEEQIYQWLEENPKHIIKRVPMEREHFFDRYFDNNKAIFMTDLNELRKVSESGYEFLTREGIHSMMAVPVESVSGDRVGTLGVCNMSAKCHGTEILDAAKLSFAMLCHNIQSYQLIREMGIMDLLTGVLNRNSYQYNLQKYAGMFRESLCCIFCDVNGLHELNNDYGHAAGDRMLKFVAEAMKEQFGSKHLYRIGGDEFVAFIIDKEPEVIRQQIETIDRKLKAHGYYASFGWNSVNADGKVDMDELVKQAEKEMYKMKRLFYQTEGRDRRMRHND